MASRVTQYLNDLGVDDVTDSLEAFAQSCWGSMPAFSDFAGFDPGEVEDQQLPPPHLALAGLLGRGGMGEVWRAHDHRLHRTVALKCLSPSLAAHAAASARFLQEAQATAQLTHPGIIPIYEVGHLSDGRPYFTMKVVEGQTLRERLDAPAPEPTALRREVDLVRHVAETLAYAHHRGVVHRDLKPENVMIGAFGEVVVMDWGLARRVLEVAEPVVTDVDGGAPRGAVGTRGYMSPEQVRGEPLGPASDVWALGVLLYEVLTRSRAFGELAWGVEPGALDIPEQVPDELAALCRRATDPDPQARPATAAEVAEVLIAWLDGALAREKALEHVARSAELQGELAAAEGRTREARTAVVRLRRASPRSQDAASKAELWQAEDHLAELERDQARLQRAALAALHSALTHVPDLPEALDALAAHHAAVQRRAELDKDALAAAEAADAVARYDRGRLAAFRAGTGALTLLTDPPGARVTAARYLERDRRLVPGEPVHLGTTPLHAVDLPMGSWLLILSRPGHADVRYPVFIPRQHHWSGVAPDSSEPTPILLPAEGTLAAADAYVPAGWFRAGENRTTFTTFPPTWMWRDAFLVRRHPVTVREYLAFLDDLHAQGRTDEAFAWAPKERSAQERAAQLNVALEDGRFVRTPDADGDIWGLDWPILNVDLPSALAFARWESARTARTWDLPDEHAWEKAARGVDGRAIAYGDRLEPAYANVRDGPRGLVLADVGDFPLDVSPFGMRGVVGGVRDWTRTPFHYPDEAVPDEIDGLHDTYVVRGGNWFSTIAASYCALRYALGPTMRTDTVGIRLVSPLTTAG